MTIHFVNNQESGTDRAASLRSGDGRPGIKWKIIGRLGSGLINLISSTIRVRTIGDSAAVRAHLESRKFIFAFWHSRILLVSYLFQGWGGAVLVSNSEDGEIMARILQCQGHKPVRGSTSKHGVRALAGLIRALKECDRPGVVVPDGPQGPRFKVQPGVILLAKKTGYPIIPVTYSASRVKIFASWDRFLLPYPFSEAQIMYGAPVSVPSDSSHTGEEQCRQRLEDELNRITTAVDEYYGVHIC